MAMRQRARQVTTTLLLATALTFTAGCKPPMHSDLMADKPPKTPIVLRDAQEEVKAPERTIKSVPVPQKKEEVKEETKKEEFKHHDMGFKDRKRTTPHFELK